MYEMVNWYRKGRCYWPVFRRPGRQRRARVGFDNLNDALTYGLMLERRYRRYVAVTRLAGLFWWFVSAGATVLVMLLGLLAWWLLVGR